MTAGEALRALHKAGRIRSPWLDGMFLSREDGDEEWATRWDSICDDDAVPDGAEPDLADPATVGCLLALLREAVHPWTPHPQRGGGAITARDARSWHVWVQTGPYARERYDGATEGEAIAAALIALAGAP